MNEISIKKAVIRKRTDNTYCVYIPKKLVDTGVLRVDEVVKIVISKQVV